MENIFENNLFNRKIKIEKESLTFEMIPPEVLEVFEKWSSLYKLDEEVKLRDFKPLFLLRYPDHLTYVGEKIMSHRKRRNDPIDTVETETMFYNVDNEMKNIGGGKISFLDPKNDDYFIARKPFVRFIENKDDGLKTQNMKKGYATQTLLAMNEYAKERYGMPLYSGETRTEDGKNLLQRYVEKGLLEEVHFIENNKEKILYRATM